MGASRASTVARLVSAGALSLAMLAGMAGCSSQGQQAAVPSSSSAEAASASSLSARSVSSEANKDVTFQDIPQDAVITAAELHSSLAQGDDAFILDIRSSGQHVNGFIPGSKNIPAGRQLDLRLDEIPSDRPIVLVAAWQERLGEARQTLIDAGFDPASIKVVSDGMVGWQNEGYPMDSEESLGC